MRVGIPCHGRKNENYTDCYTAVFEWDASSHSHGYDLWAKAIFSDGGEGCRKKIELTGEPLVEGMLVGKPENTLTTSETHQVRKQGLHPHSEADNFS